MEFFYRRHPEIGMRLELPIEPRGSSFLRSNTEEVGTCIPGAAVEVVSVPLLTITMVTVPIVTVTGFEWPVPMHRPIFSIADLKSKPECWVAAVFGRVENRHEWKRTPTTGFFFSHPLTPEVNGPE